MRLLKIVTIALLLITGPVMLESCCFSDCCGSTGIYYNIADISFATTPHPATPPYPSLSENAVKLSTVAFYFNFDLEYIALVSRSGFQAFACDPITESKQTITSIEITSSAELGDVAAGQPLNDLFESFTYSSGPGQPVAQVYGEKFLPYLSLHTATEVAAAQSLSFTFRVSLDDGRLFVLTSKNISLVP